MKQLLNSAIGYASFSFGAACLLFAGPLLFVLVLGAIVGTLIEVDELTKPALVGASFVSVAAVIGISSCGFSFLFFRQLKTKFMVVSIILAMITGVSIYLKFETGEFLTFILYPFYGDSLPSLSDVH